MPNEMVDAEDFSEDVESAFNEHASNHMIWWPTPGCPWCMPLDTVLERD
jgi:hypothetical protein